MLFNSYEFVLFFLPIVLLVWYMGFFIVRNSDKKWKNGLTLFAKIFVFVASLFFYGFFKPSYLPIILGSIIINYIFSIGFRKFKISWKRKMLLVIAIVLNISVIGYYKYLDFVITNINCWFGKSFPLQNVVLPLGISFFTFQQLSFVIDCYKKENEDYGFWEYAIFVCYFPQLIAGPIVTHDELIPQLVSEENKKFNCQMFAKGIFAFSLGLIKKVMIADTFGNVVNWGFQNIENLSSVSALLVILSYTFQIYFDFSGYCDMATGCGLMMNINLPMNFNSPYRALSITEFWKRWHMTLTRFFTKYIYIPMGGNRKGVVRTCINVMVVYLCSGIWHGANWTFILWGILHGVASVIDRLTRKYTEQWHPVIRWGLTFAFINITWVYFRADSISQANLLLSRVFFWNTGCVDQNILNCFFLPEVDYVLQVFKTDWWNYTNQAASISTAIFFIFSFIAVVNMKNTNQRIDEFKPGIGNAVFTSLIFVWGFISMFGVSTFLYFNF